LLRQKLGSAVIAVLQTRSPDFDGKPIAAADEKFKAAPALR